MTWIFGVDIVTRPVVDDKSNAAVRDTDPAARATSPNIPQLRANRCIVMIDDDHDLTGFARELAAKCGYDGGDPSLPAVAQFYQSLYGPELIWHLKDWMEKWPSSSVHKSELLAQLPISTFVSLSYCSHLEDALRLAGRRVHPMIRGSDIPYGGADQVLVVKPLGTLEQKDSLVVTENDYADLFENKKNLMRHLKQLIARHHLVLIGCNPMDEYSQIVLGGLLDGVDSTEQRCFAVVEPEPPTQVIEAWMALGVCPIALPITSLAKLFVNPDPESEITGQSPVTDRRPYKFLAYYDEQDADLFFGRLGDVDRLVTLMQSSRLTVLCGRSGVGKTSLLRAGVMPHLRARNNLPLYVRPGDDPIKAVKVAAWLALSQAQREAMDLSLALLPFLKQVIAVEGKHVTVLLDQFEECFTMLNESTRLGFAKELQSCLYHGQNELRFILSLREDFMAELHTLSPYAPAILHDDRLYRLEALSRDQAFLAIMEPARLCKLNIEPALAEKMVADLNVPGGIQPAQLSIVCDRLYDSLRKKDVWITLKHYENLGRANQILADYLDHVLEVFAPSERAQAIVILTNLITNQRTKAVLNKSQVLAGAGGEADAILERLVKDHRLIRSFEEQQETRYELAHECLIDKLQNWTNAGEEQTRAVIDLIRRELRVWRSLGHLVEKQRLDVAFAARENPALLLSGQELALLSLSAIYHNVAAEPWVARLKAAVGQIDNGIALLETAVRANDERVQQAALETMARLLDMRVLRDLGSPDADTRLKAVEALRQQGDLRTIEPLITQLNASDGRVRQAAVTALGELGDAKAVEPLIARLCDEGDEQVRQAAVEALGRLGDARAVEWLEEHLVDSDEQTQWAAAEALRRIGDSHTVNLLLQRLEHPYPWVREAAAKALGRLENKQAVEPLIERLNDWYPWVRCAVIEALGRIGGDKAVEPLVNQLLETDDGVRLSAVQALKRIGNSRTAEILIHRLDDPRSTVREVAAKTLGCLGDAQAVEPLIDRLRDWIPSVRWEAAKALGQIGGAKAIEPLLHQLSDADERGRQAAIEALRCIGDKRAAEFLVQQLGSPHPWVQQWAARALGQLGDARAVDSLLEQLDAQEPQVRWAVVDALGQVGDRRAAGRLVLCLEDRNQLVARAAARALGRLRNTDIIETLARKASDRRVLVRQAAVESLGHLGDDQAIRLLIEELDAHGTQFRWMIASTSRRIRKHHETIWADATSRCRAASALGRIGDLRATEPLLKCLGDRDQSVRQASLAALRKIRDPRIVELLVQQLSDPDMQWVAVNALGELRDARAIASLAERLSDPNTDMQWAAAQALAKIGEPQTIDLLTEWLCNQDEGTREIMVALVSIDDLQVIKPLTKGLCSPISAIRRKSAQALSVLGWSLPPDIMGAAYCFELEHRDLVKVGDPAVELLLERLEDSDRDVRTRAAWYLGRIADVRAVEPLLKRLVDDDESVRRAVVEALSQIEDARAIESLVERLDDSSRLVRGAVADALTSLRWIPEADAAGAAYWFALKDDQKCIDIGSPAVEPLVRRLEDSNPEVRKRAARCLGQIGDSRAADPLVKQLGDPDREARQATVEALGFIGDRRVVETLTALLRDWDDRIRQSAAKALGQIQDPRSVVPLIERLSVCHGFDKVRKRVLYRHLKDNRAALFLQEPFEHVRRAAAEALKQLGNPLAARQLGRQLRHQQAEVRRTTAEVLGWIGDAQAIEPLMERLGDPESAVRRAAAEALDRLSWQPQSDANAAAYWFALENEYACTKVGTAAIEPLGERLKDKDPKVRVRAVKCLGYIRDARAVELLLKQLGDRNDIVRTAVGHALALVGAPAVKPTVERLSDRNAQVRLVAAEVLGQLGDARAVEPLVEKLIDQDADVRWAAGNALRLIGEPGIAPLVDLMGNRDANIRWAAVEALGRLGDARAVEPIVERLTDRNADVRWAAANALGQLGDARAVDPLVERLKDQDADVRWAVVNALGWIEEPAIGPLVDLLGDRDASIRRAAVEALGQIGNMQAVDPLVERLDDPVDDVRQAVVGALAQIGDARAVEPLVEQLSDQDADVRWAAVEALGQIGNVQAVDPLMERLDDPVDDVRRAAVEALGQIGNMQVVDPLMERLDDPVDDVRRAVVEALAQLGHYQEMPEEPPLLHVCTTYELGEDTYDESFSIETHLGEFLGECGVGISEIVGEGSPEKVTALEAWLFDKSDIRTITVVLPSAHAYSNNSLRTRLSVKGELVKAKAGEIFSLDTSGLRVLVMVQEIEYGEAEEVPPNSFFSRITLSFLAFQSQWSE